ncbi:hypothetical protein Hamer_G001839 [Homarus americanus]|uniref:Uncharacterized protein n=1 Tax=Homarus americanus TaxID=6706 RepID=A0A8J5MRE5_HOMAM|nr:hypothetical protein Hamer_G001839 [Homarus americanus]
MEPLVDALLVSSLNAGAECIQVYDGATGTQLKSYRGLPVARSTLCLVGLSALQNTGGEGMSELSNDHQSSINQLQAANTQLFKFALKHIIDEERDF